MIELLILMPRKTLALISGLVIVTIVLFVIALRAGQQSPSQSTTRTAQPTPIVPAHTVLDLGPNPLTVAPGGQGTVNVTMNTSDNDVTAVQLELGYDPHIISNVKVTAGPAFTNPVVLINKSNPTAGRYTYAFGITPSGQPIKGTGVVATITFTANAAAAGKSMQVGLLPSTLVTARGVAQSVLKTSTGTVLTVTGSVPAYKATTTTTNTTVPAK